MSTDGRFTHKIWQEEELSKMVEKGAEATPSGWTPGKPTLKVGPHLVGRVWEVWKPDMAF
jgi:alkyl hydroperoxide reductase subunit AhpC